MRYLHTMVRVANLDEALDFYVTKFGLVETRRTDNEKGATLSCSLQRPGDADAAAQTKAPLLELTYQLGPRELYRRPQFRPSRLRGRRHLRHLPEADGCGRHHQPPAARRQHGLHQVPRQHLDRVAAARRGEARAGAVGIDAEYRHLVGVQAPLRGPECGGRPLAKALLRSVNPAHHDEPGSSGGG